MNKALRRAVVDYVANVANVSTVSVGLIAQGGSSAEVEERQLAELVRLTRTGCLFAD